MTFLIGLVAAFAVAYVGLRGVWRTGNYENFWGYLLFWSVPLYLIASVISLVL